MLDQDLPDTCQIPNLEAIYYGLFGDKRDGTFVEIGAYDGQTYSNTWGLAVMGWRGLYVEPVPEKAELCRGNHKNHPGIKVEQIAVGSQPGTLKLLWDGRELFTGDPELAEILGARSEFMEVPMTRFNDLMEDHTDLDPLDLLVLDMEGMEETVLKDLCYSARRPTMVIMEAHERHRVEALRSRSDRISIYMKYAGYIRIYCDEINNIYVSRSFTADQQRELLRLSF